MNADGQRRKWHDGFNLSFEMGDDFFNPWTRARKDSYSIDDINFLETHRLKQKPFCTHDRNEHIDIYTKMIALRVSPSIVSLQSYSGEEHLFQGSGTIIESYNTYGIILTSASLLRGPEGGYSIANDLKVVVHLSNGKSFDGQIEGYDLHYNIATIKIQSDSPLQIASLAYVNDSVTIDPGHHQVVGENSFQLRPHSVSNNVLPGDPVIALGRFLVDPYDIMAAPGKFSLNRCDYDCKELFNSSCRITRCGTGGPLINRYGEVIGICFHSLPYAAFLPINVAYKWWEHFKKSGKSRRPWLGMEMANLYAAPLDILEKILQKFPKALKGVIVEEVIPGSPADSAGIKQSDVIIQVDGRNVQSFLELFEIIWHKIGEFVELVVIRECDDIPLHLRVLVDKAKSDKLYRWWIPL